MTSATQQQQRRQHQKRQRGEQAVEYPLARIAGAFGLAGDQPLGLRIDIGRAAAREAFEQRLRESRRIHGHAAPRRQLGDLAQEAFATLRICVDAQHRQGCRVEPSDEVGLALDGQQLGDQAAGVILGRDTQYRERERAARPFGSALLALQFTSEFGARHHFLVDDARCGSRALPRLRRRQRMDVRGSGPVAARRGAKIERRRLHQRTGSLVHSAVSKL